MEWHPFDTAPTDGTRIFGLVYRECSEDMDGGHWRAFYEVREIFYKPWRCPIFGGPMNWHAGDPFDTNDGLGEDHFGDGVFIGWLPRSALPAPPAQGGR